MKTKRHKLRKWYFEEPETVKAFLKTRSKKGPNGCRLWIGATDGHGYGNIRQGTMNYRAHRLAMMAHLGKFLPRKIEVCHKCDVPLCINVKHLFIGSHRDNYLDLAKKGKSPGAKLTARNVKRIRKLLSLGVTVKEICMIYRIKEPTVYCIKTRRTWFYVK